MSNTGAVIKSIKNIMRKDRGVDGNAQRLGQLVWMFFLKILDDREAELEVLEDDYKSPLPDRLRWRNWAADPEGITGDELADFVNNDLFPSLKDLPLQGPHSGKVRVIRNVFEDSSNYMKRGTLIRQVINKVQEIDFNNTEDRHTFGAIYEELLRELQNAKDSGEFYTPRAVTRFVVDRVAPKLEETVLDPACGTGGFLTCAIDYKRSKYVRSPKDEEQLQASVHGIEVKPLPHLMCVTNMILHGIDAPSQIEYDNMLSRRAYVDYGEKDRVDVILINPPFGGTEEDGVENQFPATYRTKETASLFMALVLKLLKVGGRAAVVLPDGFLFADGGVEQRLKSELLEKCDLHTIVRLPKKVFAPYTDINTNVLFFTKRKPESDGEPATERVWFYEHPYPEGVKSYSKTKPMKFEEFEAEIDWWGSESDGYASRVETEHAWAVSLEDIKARNYNLDIKNPNTPEAESYDPEELLAQYQSQQQRIQGLRDQLKTILSEALS